MKKNKNNKKVIYSGLGVIGISAAIAVPIIILYNNKKVKVDNIKNLDKKITKNNVVNKIKKNIPSSLNLNKELTNKKLSIISQIKAIKPNDALSKGAIEPTAEKNNFDKAITNAKAQINSAKSIQELTIISSEQIKLVINLRDIYQKAIKDANADYNLKILNGAKANSLAKIKAIIPKVTLSKGAIEPTAEKNNFDKAITNAKAQINSAKLIQELTTISSEQIKLVINLRDIYQNAIKDANNKFSLKILEEAKINGIAKINNINVSIEILPKAINPVIEKNNFEQAISLTIIKINSSDSIKKLSKILEDQTKIIKNLKDIYQNAIKDANADYNLKILNGAKANSLAKIKAIIPKITLSKGAIEPTAEKNNFDKAITNAKAQINSAKSIQELTTISSEQIKLVINLRDIYQNAIKDANNKFSLKILEEAKINGIAKINNINVSIEILPKAINPVIEKNNFEQAISLTIIKINSSDSIKKLSKILEDQTKIIKNLKDIYQNAIKDANADYNLKILNGAKANSLAKIKAIIPKITLSKGAIEPTAEKNNFDKAITNAKAQINSAKSIQELTTISSEQIKLVINLRDIYQNAIKDANNKFSLKILEEAKINGIAKINNINVSIEILPKAINPVIEKNNFEQAISLTIIKINSSDSIKKLSKILEDQTKIIKNLKDIYQNAIKDANDSYTLNILYTARKKAINEIKSINYSEILLKGAIAPTADKNNLDLAINNAIREINFCNKTLDIKQILMKQKNSVTKYNDIYENAIKNANAAFMLLILNKAKLSSIAKVDKIITTKILVNGAIEPVSEKNSFEKSKADVIAKIKNIKNASEAENILQLQMINIMNKKAIYEAAIANNNLTFRILDSAKTDAKTRVDRLKHINVVLAKNAIKPYNQKKDFYASIKEAIEAINAVESKDEIPKVLKYWEDRINRLKWVYEEGIKWGNGFAIK